MNSGNFLSSRVMVGAAIVGIVGAAGVFIYEQVYAEKRRAMLVREVARLDRQVASMRSDIESLRELQKETNLRRQKQKKVRKLRPKAAAIGDSVDAAERDQNMSDSEYMTDYASVLGTESEMDSEEFYDVPTDEDDDDTLRDSLKNGHVTELLDDDPSDKIDVPKSPVKNAT